MDDYMISDRSIEMSSQSSINTDENEEEDEEEYDMGDKSDTYYESKIYREMESFYDRNYSSYEVNTIKNIFQEKIWNVCYDDIYDLTYIFVAKINQIRGFKLNTSQDYRKINATHLETEDFNPKDCTYFDQKTQVKGKKSYKDFVDKEDLIIFYNCEVEFELRLQIWNIDNRIIKDSDHRRIPIHNYSIMKDKINIPEAMSSFGHMNYIQNKY